MIPLAACRAQSCRSGSDGSSERRIAVDTRFYQDLDHGYAATVYKAQGATVDRSYVLATPHYDRHTTYFGLSRHRQAATMFYAAEGFGAHGAEPAPAGQGRAHLFEALSRARPKDLAHDYLERTLEIAPSGRAEHLTMADTDALQQQSAARWLAKQQAHEAGLSPDAAAGHGHEAGHAIKPGHQSGHHHHHRRGAEDDLDV